MQLRHTSGTTDLSSGTTLLNLRLSSIKWAFQKYNPLVLACRVVIPSLVIQRMETRLTTDYTFQLSDVRNPNDVYS
jgi:hypothetical protein